MAPNGPSYVINDVTATDCQDDQKMLEKLLSVSYGLRLTSYQRLGGYDDVNYHVTVMDDRPSDAYSNTLSVNGYVLRIFNATDSKEPQRMEATNAILDHVTRKGILTQTIVRNLQNHTISLWKFISQDKGEIRVVCLRTYLPGQSLHDVPCTAAMLFKLGAFVAEVTKALEDFHHPFFDTFNFSWSIENIPRLNPVLQYVKDQRIRQVVEQVLRDLPSELLEYSRSCKKGQIHGDLRFANILFQDFSDAFDDAFSKWGLIDFHDTHHTFAIYELAVTASDVSRVANCSTLDALSNLISGYRSVVPLSHGEIQFLVASIKARLCMLVVYGSQQIHLRPDNAGYIGDTMYPAWALLEEIHGKKTEHIVDSLLAIEMRKG